MEIFKCIIVEDEPAFVDILKDYLAEIPGLIVIGAFADTVGATLAIEKQKPDILLLDINISGLEGPEFAGLLEHQPQIVVISAHPPAVMSEYDLKITQFLQKPIQKSALKSAIEKCIENLRNSN